jgi:hypothetical protein
MQPLIAEEEKRHSFSKMKQQKEQINNPVQNPEPETNHCISESDYPQFISELVEKLIDKKTFLYEHQDELNEIGKFLNKPDLYKRVDEFLRVYYDIINDGVITSIERNKLKFKALFLKITPDTVERILNKPI